MSDDLDLAAIRARAETAKDFTWLVWPYGAGRKQIGLCFNGADSPQVVFGCTREQAEQFSAAIGDVPALLDHFAAAEARGYDRALTAAAEAIRHLKADLGARKTRHRDGLTEAIDIIDALKLP